MICKIKIFLRIFFQPKKNHKIRILDLWFFLPKTCSTLLEFARQSHTSLHIWNTFHDDDVTHNPNVTEKTF